MPTSKVSKHDLNTTPKDLDCMSRSGVVIATLLAGGWSSDAPYTQVLTLEDIMETDVPVISCGEPETLSSENFKTITKNYAMIDRAVTGDRSITFYCYSKRPTADIPLFIKI